MVKTDVLSSMLETIPQNVDNIAYACLGTDRMIGDSLGPIVGSMLASNGLKVYGTIEDPMHALTIRKHMHDMKEDEVEFVVAIDASIGSYEKIYKISFMNKPIKPGAGASKILPEVGNVSIIGITGTDRYQVYDCRLKPIVKMATDIKDTILEFERIRSKEKETQEGYYELI